jgi:uncharacterized protein (UPF0216 family)
MPVRPSITDESVFRRWMSLEVGKVNDGIVAERKYLAQLLSEDEPSAVTKAGEDYFFDKTVIEQLGYALPETLHLSLKLPSFSSSPSMSGKAVSSPMNPPSAHFRSSGSSVRCAD